MLVRTSAGFGAGGWPLHHGATSSLGAARLQLVEAEKNPRGKLPRIVGAALVSILISTLLAVGAYLQDLLDISRRGPSRTFPEIIAGLCGAFWISFIPIYGLWGRRAPDNPKER